MMRDPRLTPIPGLPARNDGLHETLWRQVAFILLALGTLSSPLFAESCAAAFQLKLIETYSSSFDMVFRAGSSAEDVDRLLPLMH